MLARVVLHDRPAPNSVGCGALDFGGAVDELVAWLGQQFDADEAAARLMDQHYPSPWDGADRGWMAHVVADGPDFREVTRLEQWQGQPDGLWLGDIIDHIARHDPARVLREIEAKRDLLRFAEGIHDHYETFTTGVFSRLEETLRLYALAYADRPGYQESWRP